MTLAAERDDASSVVADRSVRAWDVPTRLFHWTLAALIVSAYLTRNYSSDPTLYWHRINGYAILTLVLFRLFWGFVGSSTSRFWEFFPRPRATLRYGFDFARNKAQHYLGHNPLGGLIILAMLCAVLVQAGTGLFATDDVIAEGPFHKYASPAVAARTSSYHAKGFWIILGLASIHIIANVAYQFIKRDRLITAMVTGRKPALRYADQQEAVIAPAGRAAVCFALAAAIVLGGVVLSGGSLLR